MIEEKRSQWFLNRRARPMNDEDASWMSVQRMSSESRSIPWEPLGPFNVAGRSTSLALDPKEPDLVYLGTAAGGLWQSSDRGVTWTPQTDYLNVLSVGAIAVDPSRPLGLFMGTGEANLTIDSFPGLGIYRFREEFLNIGSSERGLLPNRIGSIAVDPFDPDHILIGSATIVQGDVSGLHEGRQVGEAFEWRFRCALEFDEVSGYARKSGTEVAHDAPYRCHCVLFHPGKKGFVFAAVDMRGWRSGIWRSCDAGATWTQLRVGLPATERFGRVSLALCEADPDVIWAYAGNQRGGMLGVFRSNNLGETWSSVGQSHFINETHNSYANCIVAHPKDPGWVICGGKDLHRTKDGGRTWQQITEWDLPQEDPNFAHPYHHALVTTADGFVYDANDGGMNFSANFGDTWECRSKDLVSTMVRGVDIAGSDGKIISCALQNAGLLLHKAGDPEGHFQADVAGKGGTLVFDPDDPEHRVAVEFDKKLSWHAAGEGWSWVVPEGIEEDEVDPTSRPCLTIDKSPRKRTTPRALLMGTTRLWKSRDGGRSWSPVSVDLDFSPVSAVAISSANPRVMYAATEFGAFFRSEDGGNTWSENLAGLDLPCQYITCVQVHPANSRHVFVGVGANPPDTKRSEHPAHIFVSTDGGETWRTADPNGTLPDVALNAMALGLGDPRTIYAATDFGVYRGIAEDCQNYTWEDISGPLPRAFVMDVVVHEPSQTLTVATYGRGLFRHVIGSYEPSGFDLVREERRQQEEVSTGTRAVENHSE